MLRLPLLPVLLLCFPVWAWAAPYRDTVWPLTFDLPAQWQVTSKTEKKRRSLQVLPRRAEDRERGDARAVFSVRRLGKRDSLQRLTQPYRSARGGREAASRIELDEKRGRVLLDYRESENVQNGLWIVRRHQKVWQLDKASRRVFEADCSANASEFKHYRQPFSSLCLKFAVSSKREQP
ncbi:hypothetical protein EGI20_04570 [Aquitalea sp. S1-19]|nr:hypothetical protein [Aquitalea sp. S1-19]